MIAHAITHHASEELRIRKRIESNGKKGLQTIRYIILQVEHEKEYIIWIRPGHTEINVTTDPFDTSSPVKERELKMINN